MKITIYLLQISAAILMIYVFPIYFATSAEIDDVKTAQFDVVTIDFTSVGNRYIDEKNHL